MAAEIRVDTIKGRAGINTLSFAGDGFSFDKNVGIGTTVVTDPVSANNPGKLAVGIVTCKEVHAQGWTVTGIVTATSANFSGTGAIGISTGTTAQRPGSPVDGDIRYNTTTASYEGYGNGAWGGLGGGTEIDTSVSSTSATGVGSFAAATYRAASVKLQINQNANYQIGRYLMIHDGTTATVVEEAAIATGSMLGTISGDINNSNVELQVTMGSSGIATVTTIIDKISI
tara:strand:- start:307 stop:993 length:687 start_codon:yes stop_codon:yes gene_type:complete